MVRRAPGEARVLGLWTAGCLAVLLLIGIVWVGDIALQWPVFVVPLLWAAVSMRPQRREVRPGDRPAVRWEPPVAEDGYPVTREAPTLPRVPRGGHRREW